MMWFFAVLLVLLIGGIAVVAAGHGDELAPVDHDTPDLRIPDDRRITGADLREVRFSTALRGYRAAEVDALLARLARELDGHDHKDTQDGTREH